MILIVDERQVSSQDCTAHFPDKTQDVSSAFYLEAAEMIGNTCVWT